MDLILQLRLLGPKRRFLAAGLSAAIVGVYTLLVGADAAVVRAAIMGGLSLFARQVGRRQDGLNSLAFVAATMAVFNPYLPWDVGFQLSFMATLGLVLYAEPLSQVFLNFAARRLPLEKAKRLAGPVGEYFLFTLAAQIMTLPVTIYHFQRFSLTSFLANPVILPAQPPVMILGGLAVLLGLVYKPLGQLAAYLAWPFVVFTIRAVEWIAAIPGGVVTLGDVSLFWICLFYAVLLLWTFGGERFKGLGNYLKPSAVITGLGLVCVVVWQTVLATPDGRLHLTVLDVGSGEALLIQAPGGERLLVNGGPSPSALSDALGRRLPLTRRSLDYLVVASPSENQLAALPRVIERFPVKAVLWAGPTHASRSARDLQDAFANLGIRPILVETGQSLDLGNGARLHILVAGPRGAALLLEWGSFRAMLPLGLDFETLESLQADRNLTSVTALLLAESGYAPANPPEWIEGLHPSLVLLSVAADDRDGLPDRETLEAVQGYTLLRTDRDGWIHLSTDGEQMWVEVERRFP